MRIGLFSVLDAYPAPEYDPASRRIEETLQLGRRAERSGLDAFWVGEHHFQSAGVLPAPAVFLGALARETRRIRIGSMVAVLPLHSPRELAEQYALVDVLSSGRLEIGIGSGYSPIEFRGFGLDPAQRQAAFERAKVEFLRALRGGPLSAPDAPDGTVRLNVRSLQRPCPPIWTAAVRREAVQAAGTRGERLALIPYAGLDREEDLATRICEYRDLLPPGVAPRVLAAMHFYVGPNPGIADRALDRWLDTRPAPDSPPYLARLAAHPELRSARGLRDRGLVLMGDRRSVRDRLGRLERYGVTDLAAMVDFGGMPSGEVRESLRWLTEVRDELGGRDPARPDEIPFTVPPSRASSGA